MKTHTSEILARHSKQQKGAVLFVALVLLLALTLIGVTAMQTTTLQERMAGNMRDQNLAFQAAEAALRHCEGLLNLTVIPTTPVDGFYDSADYSDGEEPVWKTVVWSATDSYEYGTDAQDIANVTADPRCIIEQLPPVVVPGGSLASDVPTTILMYRVTARAQGGSPNTLAILQTTYRR